MSHRAVTEVPDRDAAGAVDPVASPAVVRPPAGVAPARPAEDGTVVVRAPNWVGDAVLALPAVTAITRHFDAHPVLVMARSGVAPLFAGLPGLAGVVLAAGHGPMRMAVARRSLAGRRPALGVVLPHSVASAAELQAGGTREVWGYGGLLRRLALDRALPPRWIDGRHRWEEYALLAAAVTGRPVEERYAVVTGPGDAAAADGLFAEAGFVPGSAPAVGLFPGANATSRRWPVERFAALASRLGRAGCRVVVFGGPGDRELAAGLTRAAEPAPLDWSGRTTLPVLAECFRRIDVLVTNDTGPMHLAAAVGTPLVDLCGAADERVTGPRGERSEVVVHPVHCRPCVDNRCAYGLECMRGIGVETVSRIVAERIEAAAAAAP